MFLGFRKRQLEINWPRAWGKCSLARSVHYSRLALREPCDVRPATLPPQLLRVAPTTDPESYHVAKCRPRCPDPFFLLSLSLPSSGLQPGQSSCYIPTKGLHNSIMDDAYVRSPRDVLAHFGVAEHSGLSDSKVEASRLKHGKNGRTRSPLRDNMKHLLIDDSYSRGTSYSALGAGA